MSGWDVRLQPEPEQDDAAAFAGALEPERHARTWPCSCGARAGVHVAAAACALDDATVVALCGGGLRDRLLELDLSDNAALTRSSLSFAMATQRQLVRFAIDDGCRAGGDGGE